MPTSSGCLSRRPRDVPPIPWSASRFQSTKPMKVSGHEESGCPSLRVPGRSPLSKPSDFPSDRPAGSSRRPLRSRLVVCAAQWLTGTLNSSRQREMTWRRASHTLVLGYGTGHVERPCDERAGALSLRYQPLRRGGRPETRPAR